MTAVLTLAAPFAAWLGPLDEVPDAVFAGRLLGDGVALDPLDGAVRSPCDGTVAAIAPTAHSVTLLTESGAEVLIHVGVDTVALGGTGFMPVVGQGDRVSMGDMLLRFDLDAVARGAASVRTPMIVLGDPAAMRMLGAPRLVVAGEPILEVVASAGAHAATDAVDARKGPVLRTVAVALSHGLHARPAARIIAALRPFDAAVELRRGGSVANARSVTSILALGVRHGDSLEITGRGPEATTAVDAVQALIASGMGEEGTAPAVSAAPVSPAAGEVEHVGLLRGVRAAPGGAVGPAFQLRLAERAVPERGASAAAEERGLLAAREAVRDALQRLAQRSEIAEAHLAILEDPDILGQARQRIEAGASAAAAWRAATRAQVFAIEATGNTLLAERAADLRDVERHMVDALLGGEGAALPEVPEGSILLAAELLPTQLLGIAEGRVAGIVTVGGGPTSHVAIIAAARGIPMIVSAGSAVLAIPDGTALIVGDEQAVVHVAPDDTTLAAYHAHLAAAEARALAAERAAAEPARTADGTRIEVFANCGSAEEAALARSLGAEGCGLLRTEFLFLGRATAPSEDEQVAAYAAVAAALGGAPVIVRTLDAGSDKPIPYIPMPAEENPALGMRGVRVSLARPDLLREQLRAILRGVPPERCRIMLPMVNDLSDYRRVAAILRVEEAALGIAAPTPLGIMVETPAAAMLADGLAREAAFLSIGTNDLVQYALAADRGNEAVAALQDALHPAVLRLIAEAARGAHAHGRWLGVCGALASDPDAAPLLVGLGVDELSAAPRQVPAIKARLAGVTVDACRALAREALAQDDAAGVRRLAGAMETC